MTTVLYYVSGHGLGHAARALGVCAALPAEVRLVVRSLSPRWFWEGELPRPFEWHPQGLDAGAVQLDNLRSDGPASLRRAAEVEEANRRRFDAERAFVEEIGADVVVCDIPPFPLRVAEAAGVPSALVANFTWVDIYRPYLPLIPPGPERARLTALVDALAEGYRAASLILRTPLSMEMPELPRERVVDIPLITRSWTPRREALCRELAIPPGHRVALISVGLYGVDLSWEQLGALPRTTFVAFNAPAAARSWVRPLAYPAWRSQDVTASVDAVVAKAGYGTLAECMAAGTPLIFPPRPSFAEHEALAAGARAWGGGVGVDEARFRSLELGEALDAACAVAPLPVVRCDGGPVAAAHILALANGIREE